MIRECLIYESVSQTVSQSFDVSFRVRSDVRQNNCLIIITCIRCSRNQMFDSYISRSRQLDISICQAAVICPFLIFSKVDSEDNCRHR